MTIPLSTNDFDYDLPKELIAQTPNERRDSSRLLVLNRATGVVTHRNHFTDILDFLQAGDLLIFNDSRVLAARVYGRFVQQPISEFNGGGAVELLLINRISTGVWQCLGKPSRKLHPGTKFVLEGNGLSVPAHVLSVGNNGLRTVEVENEEALAKVGTVPLPPYIHQMLTDPERYQTVYSRELGSAAAPTAGLHFTPELMNRLTAMGIEQAFVTLHVGLDTFRPVQTDDPTKHIIHTERWEVPQSTADAVNRAKSDGRRVVAVGTTSVRVLETAAHAAGGADTVAAGIGSTGLFILPGYSFQAVDAMVTNFHMPRSTLLMLISAFVGREVILNAYQEAIRERYRFLSFGDGMFIG